ncbi:RHS repeat-associated core domain-containing protein [Flavobacterium columnare]|uniref:RHS repeat-associated core domain-containing protein n=1 Tax=Flavobacterium columnare TaxID=996 RepID=UPI0040346E26
MYGKLRNFNSHIGLTPDFIPFRQLGQYEDPELDGLYYNRFRYYDCETGLYLSQDPIGLAGNNPTIYGYTKDSNTRVDVFGLVVTNTVDFAGHSDLFPVTGNQKNIVQIKLQGRRGQDFTQAFKEAGIKRSEAKNYTWHHLHDFDSNTGTSTMQLILRTTHEANYPHKGSAGQFADEFNVKYDSDDAVNISKSKGWHSSCN